VTSGDELSTIEQLFERRSSCRGFAPQPVERALIERVLAAAQKTASWCNSQPWQVIVTSGTATETFRDALYAHASSGSAPTPDFPFPREYRGVYLDRRRDAGFRLYDAVGIARGDRVASARQGLENFRFFGAPHVAIITSDDALGTYGAVDCGGYVANFLLAAEAAGLACIPQAALAAHAAAVREHLKIPEDRQIVCGISFGRPDLDHPANRVRTPRASLSEAIDWRE
jgi:nitroreductase